MGQRSWCDGLTGSPRKSRTEGQEDKGRIKVKELGGTPPAKSRFLPSCLVEYAGLNIRSLDSLAMGLPSDFPGLTKLIIQLFFARI